MDEPRNLSIAAVRMTRSGPRRATVAPLAVLLLAPAIASADWLDDMPSIDEVARAVRQQNREDASAYSSPSARITADDPGWYAARLAGTLEMLRWHMLFEALRESNPPVPPQWMPLWPPKRDTLQRAATIAAEYRQVELALERGVGTRPRGHHQRLCTSRETFLNRFGQKMYSEQECYQFLFDRDSNIQHVFKYRQAMFPRLFCSQGLHYHERYQQYFIDGMSGSTGFWDRPHNYAFKRIHSEHWPAIAQPKTTAEVCAAYGGDKDGNGICDAWQAALKDPAADAGGSECVVCPDPDKSGLPPYSSVVRATWDASREAVARGRQDALVNAEQREYEWGGFIYPVKGGFRYLAPVTSQQRSSLDLGAVAVPAFDRLFAGKKPQSCKYVATYHTHPEFWSVPGLSLTDLKNAVSWGVPAYVMRSGNTAKLYVYRPGRSPETDRDIERLVAFDEWHYEMKYNVFQDHVDVLTEE